MADKPYWTDENGVTRVKACCTVVTSSGLIKGAGEIITLSKGTTEAKEEVNDGE